MEGDDPEFDESGFEEPGFEDPALDPGLEDPGFDGAALGVPAVPGKVPQGEPLGVPGALGAFGFTVEGCVLLPGVGLPGEFEPGTVPGVGVFGFCGVGVAVPAGGVAVLGGGVVGRAGGVAVLGGGVAVPGGGVAAPGLELCPAEPALDAGAPPPELCATTHVDSRITVTNARNLRTDMRGLQSSNYWNTFFDSL